MTLTKEKSILIIAPNLISESLSLKLTSLDNNLKISFNANDKEYIPDLIIWNILNYQSEDLVRLELLKFREKWLDAKILIIFSGELLDRGKSFPSLNSEGLLLNPNAEKVLQSINTIINGGRVFDLDKKPFKNKKSFKKLYFNQKILTSGLKQIDKEINYIYSYLNNDYTPNFYNFILKGRLRELITAKSLLIFLWGNSVEENDEQYFIQNEVSKNMDIDSDSTIFISDRSSIEIWNLIFNRLINKFTNNKFDLDFNNSSLIISGLKNEYISRLICNILNELDHLIKNIKMNYDDKSYENELSSFINELKKNAISNIAENYLRIKKDNESISVNKYIYEQFEGLENDPESHNSFIFIDPIINDDALNYDGKLLPLYETESFKIFEAIITNWVIRTSNVLASEIFNFCAIWPELRTTLISNDLQSTRSFERFRNNINNYNRWHNNIYMPICLYESKREFFDVIDNKFVKYFKNENREKDLASLEWFQKQVTLIVEIRDAISPQLEIAFKYIGNIFVTLLTKIIGKAIGLIGKGILQGLGKSNSK